MKTWIGLMVLGLASCTGEPPREETPPPFIGPGNFSIRIECRSADPARTKLRLITIAIEDPVKGDGTVIVRENSVEGTPPVLDMAVAYTLPSVKMNEIYRIVRHQRFFDLPPHLLGPDQERACTVQIVSDRQDHTVRQSGKISHPFNELCLELNRYLLPGCEITAPEVDVLRPRPMRVVFAPGLEQKPNLPLAIKLYEREYRDPEIESKADVAYALAVLYRRSEDLEKSWHYTRRCRDHGREDYYRDLARALPSEVKE